MTGDFTFDIRIINKLALESQTNSKEHSIIRRRISWLIGKWIVVKASNTVRPIIYDILLTLLKPEQDIVVKLTAVSDLRICIDDFDFISEQFQPYLPQTLHSFMSLLDDVDEFENKLKILNCLIAIAERMEGLFLITYLGQIVPFISTIIQVLTDLWSRSEGQNIFRTSIVTILTKLIIALRSESHQLHHVVLPILKQSLDTTNVSYFYI
jgi:hypothetical protein